MAIYLTSTGSIEVMVGALHRRCAKPLQDVRLRSRRTQGWRCCARSPAEPAQFLQKNRKAGLPTPRHARRAATAPLGEGPGARRQFRHDLASFFRAHP